MNPDGTYTYTPDEDFFGEDEFTYVACDGGTPEYCDTAVVTINIVNPDEDDMPPVANDDDAATEEGNPVTSSVLGNDSDPDGGELTVNPDPVTEPENGTLVLNPDGTYTYTPDPGFTGEDTFVYEVCDDADPAQCDTAMVTITVIPADDVNDPPVAEDDAAFTDADTPVTGSLTDNDTDPNGDPLTVNTTPVSGPTNGTVTINPDGTYTYTPDPGFSGNDEFVYEICDNGNPVECDQATVYITVMDTNDAPIAVDDEETAEQDTPLIGTVITNDSDPNGDDIEVTEILDEPENGVVGISPDGTYTYTPTPGFTGVDSFTYVLCDDGNPVLCDTATVTITVNPNPCELPVVANVIVVEADCGIDNGSITVDLSNDNPANYEYAWSPSDVGTLSADGSMLSDLPVGVYNVTISEVGMPDCAVTEDAIVVSLSDTITIDTVMITPANCDAADAEVTIMPDTLIYTWEGGLESNVNTGLTAGTYIVTVTDPSNPLCSDLLTVEVPSVNLLTGDADIVTEPSCSDSTGVVTIVMSNGSGDYTFTWEDGENGDTRNDLSAGSYVVNVTDNVTGCETDVIFGLSGGGGDGSATITINDVAVTGCEEGQIFGAVDFDVELSDDFNEPATITVTDGMFNYESDNLLPGDYCVEVRDSIGCLIATECFVVEPIQPLSVLLVINGDNCFSDIDVIAQGGYGEYTFDWADIDGTENDEDRTSLPAGFYSLTVTDAGGCTSAIDDIEIITNCVDTVDIDLPIGTDLDTCLFENYLLTVGAASVDTCEGGSGNGLVDLTFGSDPLCINLEAIGGEAGDIEELCLVVCDSNDVCQNIIINVTITEPLCVADYLGIADSLTLNAVDCESQATICVPIPIEELIDYTFMANDSIYDGGFAGCNFDTIISYNYFTLFGQGDIGPYTVTSWTMNDETFSGEFMTMTDLLDSLNTWDTLGNWVINETALLITGGYSGNTYGDIDVTHNFTGSLSTIGFNNGLVSNGIELSFSVGLHEVVIIENATGCVDTFVLDVVCDSVPEFELVDLEDVINVGDTVIVCPDELGFVGDLGSVTNICPDDAAEFAAFELTEDDCLMYIGITEGGPDTACLVICNLEGVCDTALVSVTVIDTTVVDTINPPIAVNDYDSTEINVPVEIVVVNNDTIEGEVTMLTVLTDPLNGIVTTSADSAFTYVPDEAFCGVDSFQYIVCNNVGCDTAWVFVTIQCEGMVIFTGISPNGDGVNDSFTIQGIEQYDAVNLCIYNRWGNQVFQNADGVYRNDWTGTWNGKDLPDGTYFYVLDLGDGSPLLSGYIQIRR